MKSTTSTATRPTAVATPVNPVITASPAVQRLQDVRRAVQEARDKVVFAQAAASAPTLRQHEAEVLRTAGVYLDGDAALLAAVEAGSQARQVLTAARAALRRAEQAQEGADQAVAAERTAADRAWRRTWALAHHPELVTRLTAAQAEEGRLTANEYTGSSIQGLADIRFVRGRIVAIEEAIGRVAKQAPGLGSGVQLPADWANLTPEEQRAHVVRVEELATLAAG